MPEERQGAGRGWLGLFVVGGSVVILVLAIVGPVWHRSAENLRPDPIRVPVHVYPDALVCDAPTYPTREDVPAGAIPAAIMNFPSEDLGWRACWASWEEGSAPVLQGDDRE